MDLKTLRKETEYLIAEGETREALDFLLQNLRAGTDARAEVAQLSGAFNECYDREVVPGTLFLMGSKTAAPALQAFGRVGVVGCFCLRPGRPRIDKSGGLVKQGA